MPTDGTLLLEYMPRSKQYLVTALSVFFSLGAVLAAVVGLLVIPSHSCTSQQEECPQSENLGWKYMLTALAAIVRPWPTLFVMILSIDDIVILDDRHVRRPDPPFPVVRVTALSRQCRTT
jgi:MFS family permease